MMKPARAVLSIFTVLVIGYSLLHNFIGNSFHGDENLWIFESRYFRIFFIEQDVSSPKWSEDWAYDQPQIGKYAIGLSLFLAGVRDVEEEMKNTAQWRYLKGDEWNIQNRGKPPAYILFPARLGMVVFAILSCMLILIIGEIFLGPFTGILAALCAASSPLMLSCCRRAMPDPLLLFLLLSAVLMTGVYLKIIFGKTQRGVLVCSMLLGFVLAMGVGVKFSGMLGVVYFSGVNVFLALHFAFGKAREVRVGPILTGLSIALTMACVFFIISDPYLYPDPVRRLTQMLSYRADSIKFQQENIGPALLNVWQRAGTVYHRFFQTSDYAIFGKFFKFPVDFVLFLAGLAALGFRHKGEAPSGLQVIFRRALLFWSLLSYLSIILWLPLDWDRYYLPLLPGTAWAEAYALFLISKVVIEKFRLKNRAP